MPTRCRIPPDNAPIFFPSEPDGLTTRSSSYFEVDKRRVSIHATRPYSEERRQRQSQWAKENGLKGSTAGEKA